MNGRDVRMALENSGFTVEATFSEANVREIFLPLLERLTALRRREGRRVLALLAAPPGAGKSTLAAFLEQLSRRQAGLEPLIVLGMDGFHYPQAYLRAHTALRDGVEVPLTRIKGAPESFDVELLRRTVARVAAGEVCGWPRYSRTLHDPVPDASRAEGGVVLIEGNYLLLDAPVWRELRGYADYTIAITADPERLCGRLVARHVAGGRSEAEAAAFVEHSDLVNARLCLARSLPADLTLRLLDDDTFRVEDQ